MIKDLIDIKDKYGEKMMHLCRKYFSTILEDEGKLFELMSSHFAYSRFLYEDIVNNALKDQFINYIYSLLEPPKELPVVIDSPRELFSMVGYDLYECYTEDDINSFLKYYSSNEKLCTFRGNRLNKCHVFFAVKKDVDAIKRDDYFNPQRQDRYGTSVISIQFTRGDVNILSIKNRYNHEVVNPDATFSNNLENIIPGLTKSFERDYNLNICQNNFGDFELPGYVMANDGKFYKYNYEINNIYYCPDNIIIDNSEVIRDYHQKEKYIVIDYFIIDLVNKKISLYDNTLNDSFITGLDNIKKIEVNKNRATNGRIINITFENGTGASIEIDKCNRIVAYTNNNLTDIGDNFLYYNKYLEKIDVSNVLKIGNGFLYSNNLITSIDLSKLLEIKDDFLCNNTSLNDINVSKVISVGNNFLKNNRKLISLYMPFLEKTGDNFVQKNQIIKEIFFPKLVYAGNWFMQCNKSLITAFFPKLVYAGNWFISANKTIDKVDFSELQEVGDNFLACNNSLLDLCMFSLRKAGKNFMFCNKCMLRVILPMLESVGMKFFYYNNSIRELVSPYLRIVGDYFLYNNVVLENGDYFKIEKYGKGLCGNIKKKVLKMS